MNLSSSDIEKIREDLLAEMITTPSGDPVPPPDQHRTVAHLMMTVRTNLGHVRRHLDSAMDADSAASLDFNLHHASRHTDDAMEHMDKVIHGISGYDQEVGDEIEKLQKAIGDEV